MLMSQRTSSAALTGSPTCGAGASARCGVAHAASATAAHRAMPLRVYMFHAPVAFHGPAHDRVVVKAGVWRVARAPVLPQRLQVALLIGGAALQHCRAAVPFPRMAEAHE